VNFLMFRLWYQANGNMSAREYVALMQLAKLHTRELVDYFNRLYGANYTPQKARKLSQRLKLAHLVGMLLELLSTLGVAL